MRMDESSPVIVRAILVNLEDRFMLRNGAIEPGRVRTVTADDAVVDPGVSDLLVPSRLIEALGLRRAKDRSIRTPHGTVPVRMHEAVRLTIQARDCTMEVQEIQGDSPVRIGRIPLLARDWVVDSVHRKLIGNPEHGGEWIIEAF
jgi:hypothetical protein